jgi:methyl coenzyme M reductase beta subunit
MYDVPIHKANMVKGAVWGRYPQTMTRGLNLKSILEVPQNNEGADMPEKHHGKPHRGNIRQECD